MEMKEFFEGLRAFVGAGGALPGGAPTEEDLRRAPEAGAAEERERAAAAKAEAEARAAREALQAETAARIDRLVEEGRIPPALVDLGLKDFAASLAEAGSAAGPEGEGALQPLDWFMKFLDRLAEWEVFRVVATKDQAGRPEPKADEDAALGGSIAAKVA